LSDSLVIIPTYNEKENIARILEAVFALPQRFDVLIIDDGSPDGTAEIVRQLQSQLYQGQLFLEERTGKLGLGTAYIHGFQWALAHENQYQYIFEMDADFSHPPADLTNLYTACASSEKVGVAIGSRYVRGGQLVNWPFKRRFLSRGASIYVQIATFMPVKDPTAGFVCYRRAFLERLDMAQITFVGYAFQIEMKFAAWQLGFALKEIPITFTDRTAGTSKMSSSIFYEALLGVLRIRWKGWFGRYGLGINEKISN
jgi:dolichol-phosphate mannosyltransferase